MVIIVKVVKNKDSTLRKFVDSVLFWRVLCTEEAVARRCSVK